MKEKLLKHRTLIDILAIVIVACLICIPLLNSKLDVYFDDGLPDPTSKEDVWYVALHIVSQNLKAPSTAQFCRMSQGTITQTGDTWTIKGYVDAENSRCMHKGCRGLPGR